MSSTPNPDKCSACTNQKNNRSCPSGGNCKSDLVILGESPGDDEIDSSRCPFSVTGPTGKFVRYRMKKNGIMDIEKSCFLINALNCDVNAACWRENYSRKKYNLAKNCIDRVRCEILQEERKLIFVLGGVAKETMNQITKLDLNQLGTIYHWQNNTHILCTHHPSRIIREECKKDQKQMCEEFAEHTEAAIQKYNSL